MLMIDHSREAWQSLYSKHGIQYGGSGDLSMLGGIVQAGMLVLDAGCGDGKTTEMLARESTVVGCDFSREALVSLKIHRDPDSVVNLVECELGHLPFGPEKFDVVCCIHALSHMLEADRREAAKEAGRVLKPGGHLYAEAFGTGDMRFGKGNAVERASFLRGNGIMTHYFEERELRDLFKSLDLVADAKVVSRVAYGASAGRREVIRILARKQ